MTKMLLTTASVAAALALALSGCGAHDRDDAPSAETAPSGDADPFNNVIKYAECLQQHGLNVKIKPGDGWTLPKGYDPAVKEAAEAACRSVAPPGMFAKPSAEELDKDVKVAQCLRAEGVDVKDPTMDEPQLRISNPPGNLKELQEVCEKKAGLHDGSGGSGGAG